MQLVFLGEVDRDYFTPLVYRVAHFFPIPRDLRIYIVGEKRLCTQIMKTIPKKDHASFRQVCILDKLSFSFQHNEQRLLVISLTKDNRFFLTDAKAFQGLLLHELQHIEHMKKGVYRRLQSSYKTVFTSYVRPISKLTQKNVLPTFQHVGESALLFIKDLYANSALLQKGYGHYLLRYYHQEFSLKKTCPRPVFYDKLQREAKKDPPILESLFAFEFALLSVILPFVKYKERRATTLIRYITRCYNINMKDLIRKCRPFISIYLSKYKQPNDAFAEAYFHLIFTKLVELLA